MRICTPWLMVHGACANGPAVAELTNYKGVVQSSACKIEFGRRELSGFSGFFILRRSRKRQASRGVSGLPLDVGFGC